jgi:hypothetical protein
MPGDRGQPGPQHLTDQSRQPPGTPSPRTPKSISLEASVAATDQDPRHDTPGGSITGNRVVPCSWLNRSASDDLAELACMSALARRGQGQSSSWTF